MGAGGVVLAQTFQAPLDCLRATGADVDAVLARAGVRASDLDPPFAPIPHERWIEFLEICADATGDPAFGLRAAERATLETLDVFGYLARSCRNLREAVDTVFEYSAMWQESADLRVEVHAGRVILSHHNPKRLRLPRVAAEYMVASWYGIGAQLTGAANSPLEVRFLHAKPEDTRELERVFRAPLRFEAEHTALVFPASELETLLPNGDAGLRRLLEKRAKALLRQTQAPPHLAGRVRELLVAEIADGGASLERVAGELHMSPRTLRRRLQQEGTTYRQLFDDLRRDLAERYLRHEKRGVAETALLLGFADSSALHRAFRRWGGSPSELRGATSANST